MSEASETSGDLGAGSNSDLLLGQRPAENPLAEIKRDYAISLLQNMSTETMRRISERVLADPTTRYEMAQLRAIDVAIRELDEEAPRSYTLVQFAVSSRDLDGELSLRTEDRSPLACYETKDVYADERQPGTTTTTTVTSTRQTGWEIKIGGVKVHDQQTVTTTTTTTTNTGGTR